ncbi:polymerase/histidinol phosphatase-like protein [Apiosordaria backusii]|uniref:Histidinol-phosphatase n=1 Tax=Apiosordaria backusii TaxID=314023 RepID=A0AA40AA73_9PEZI|nr:polymerase/histidinol phosphatase-like protein [Apiosordaria backusii]
MAFTMHSHSGQFCPGHAVDSLESIILRAISLGYKTLGLTEHMPRTSVSDLYPEELLPTPQATLDSLFPRHEEYLSTAASLQEKYADKIHILIGFEGEWIRGEEYGSLITELAKDPRVDYFIGSCHHTAGIPIDYDKALYQTAVQACGGTEEGLYERYFDEQFDMLSALKPKVVGHFDLIRLMSEDPARELRTNPKIWDKIVRNLEKVREFGGWLEMNTSGLRKGMAEGYPKREIAEEWVKMGGRFTFSDDSHGIGQVATNYLRGLDYLESLGVQEVWTLERDTHPGTVDGKKSGLREKSVTIGEFKASLSLP